MRQQFLGCPVDTLTMAEAVAAARVSMRANLRLHHAALNVAKLVNMRRDRVLAADVAASDLITMDGMGIVWGAKLLGLTARDRVTGIDLFSELLGVCAREGFMPYFLGATGPTLDRAVEVVQARYPDLRFAGMRDGYFAVEQEGEVVSEIKLSGAHCLFIGMPTPRKERFLAAHRDELGVPFIMGVGGSFDVLSGRVRRAPKLMQRLGIEWLYRIYQEPRRMWWRYARTNVIYLGMLIWALVLRGAQKIFGAAPPPRAIAPSDLSRPRR